MDRVVMADPLTEEFYQRWQEDLDGIPMELILLRDPSDEALRSALAGAKVLIVKNKRIDEELLKAAGGRLKAILKLSQWPIDVDVRACMRKGIEVRMIPPLGCISVAEHAMMLVLACARKLIQGHLAVVKGTYRDLGLVPFMTAERKIASRWVNLAPFEVYGKTLGIVGMGEIGRHLAVRARCFGMKVLYSKRTRFVREIEEELGVTFCELPDLLRASDFVSLNTPLTEKTARLIDRTEFQAMRPSAFLVNTARGGVVDEEALVWALQTGKIAGAGLDVFAMEPLPFNHPLVQLENVVLSPHYGGGSGTGRAVLAAELRTLITEFSRS